MTKPVKIQERKNGEERLLYVWITKACGVLGWKKGDKVNVTSEGGNIVLKKEDG